MRRLGATLLTTVAVALVVVGGSRTALAQETPTTAPTDASAPPANQPISWSVGPATSASDPDRPNFVVDAEPGETISDSLVVSNRSDVNLVLGVYARDAFNTPEGKIDLLAGDEDPVDVGKWTTPESASITVPAGGEMHVPFTIAVPLDASPGDHVGGIVTSLTITEQDADGNRVRVERRLGTRIYLRVAGELTPSLEFTKVSATYEGTWNPLVSGSMTVKYSVKNTGNVRLRAERVARVATSLGLPERSDEADDMAELLPGNSYDLRQDVSGVWPALGTNVEVELRPYDSLPSSDVAPAAVIGRYKTSMFPTPQLIAIIVVVLALALIWRSRRRNRRNIESAIEAAVSKALADKSTAELVTVGAAHDPGTPPPWNPEQ